MTQAQQNFLKVFIQHSKKSQHNRDGQKIQILQAKLRQVSERCALLQMECGLMRQHYEKETQELRMANIRLLSENKAIGLRNEMLQKMVEESQNSTSGKRIDLHQVATFRILQDENRKLKQLIKQYMIKNK